MSKTKRKSGNKNSGHQGRGGHPRVPAMILRQSMAEYQSGGWNRAEALCRSVINESSRYSQWDLFDALNLLGIIAAQTNRAEEAIGFFVRATSLNPHDIAAHMNLGRLLRQCGRPEAAITSFEQALKLQPDLADAHYLRGLALADLGRHELAIESFDRALSLETRHAGAHNDKGIALVKRERHDEALRSFDNAIACRPDYADAIENRGNVLVELKRLDDALESYNKAVSLAPGRASAYFNRAKVLDQLKRHDEAFVDYEHAVRLDPNVATAWMNRGLALYRKKRYEESLDSYRRAILLEPDDPTCHNNMAITLVALHQIDAAMEAYDRALAIDPDFVEAYNNRGAALLVLKRYADALENYEQALKRKPDLDETRKNIGLLCFAMGDLERGWAEYEYRWTAEQERQNTIRHGKPRWQGDKSDRKLFVWAEQGIGDQILHGTILRDILDYPQKKTVSLNTKLLPLFRRSFDTLEFISKDNDVDFEDYDEQIPVGSLGRIFRPAVASFGKALHQPYLRPDKSLSEALQSRIRKPGKITCGISWFSRNPEIGDDKGMFLKALVPALAMPHVDFIDLQYGDTSAERQNLHDQFGIDVTTLADIDNFNNLDGLAALIDACDVVVTVSNTTAHLAGALGKKTLLLLPAGRSKLWYWHSTTGACLWYPSVEIFEQQAPGLWADPLSKVRRYLEVLGGDIPPART
jgi:tetratricopeptide (TPR) repeat protein